MQRILKHFVDQNKASKENVDKFGRWLTSKGHMIPKDGDGFHITMYLITHDKDEMEPLVHEYFRDVHRN